MKQGSTVLINLFDMFTVSREEAERNGGAYIETLNMNEDGVVYIKADLVEMANQFIINQLGEKQ